MNSDPSHPLAGRRLGRYELLSRLGAGGMGEVYRARDLELGREVAVKVLPSHLSEDPEALARFKREAKAVAALSHPNILAIFDFGTEAGVSFAVMELLQGETLRARLERGPIAWRLAVEIGSELAQGLAAAHAKGITHRDLKPENIFLGSDGQVKILDFGLARVRSAASQQHGSLATVTLEPTEPGTVLGTAGYMSPEQVRGDPIGPASDVFSLGCVLYEMVTGQRAFGRRTFADSLTAILHDEPPALAGGRVRIPASLERVIRRCIEKTPEQRYDSTRDLMLDLKALPGAGRTSLFLLLRNNLPRPRGRAAASIAAIALLAMAGWAAYRLMPEKKAIDSLAVLPFVNASADGGLEYLSDGISESIGHSLSQIPKLKVMSRTSVVRYKGRQPDARTVGRELGVRAIVLGEVALRGDEMALSVELVDASDRRLLWGERYTRRYADVLGLQAEIAKQISEKLRLRLTREQEQRLEKSHTHDPEAYRLYLQGRYHSLQWTTEGWKTGIEYMNRAIHLDPTYAVAYAGLAACYYDASGTYLPPSEAMPKAKAAARKALELDETLAEAHASLAQVLAQYEWNWTEARKEYERALELNPNDSAALQYFAMYNVEQGRIDPAIIALTRATELDPLTPQMGTMLAWFYHLARQSDQTIARCRKIIEEHPDFAQGHYTLALGYEDQGRFDEAIASLNTARQLDPPSLAIVGLLGHAYALAGRRVEALKFLGELQDAAKREYVEDFDVARILAGLGNEDEAFVYLQRAYSARSEQLLFLKVDPHFDSLRSDPRFEELLRRIGLSP